MVDKVGTTGVTYQKRMICQIWPNEGTTKLNVDGYATGNPRPASFGDLLRRLFNVVQIINFFCPTLPASVLHQSSNKVESKVLLPQGLIKPKDEWDAKCDQNARWQVQTNRRKIVKQW